MYYSKFPHKFKIIDTSSSFLSGDILFPFAFDEFFCRRVGAGISDPIVHIWRHNRAFIVGLRDRKLPYALEAMQGLEERGFFVTVRHSGGAAVPLDLGVVNISFILPSLQGKIDFRQDFELMYLAIRESLKQVTSFVNKGEIYGAYCPGDFDLSIAGKKFCGIAQRRQTKACIIQAFVTVEGSGQKRGELVKDFYRIASGGRPELDYPIVNPDTMASLSELTDIQSSAAFVTYLKEHLKANGECIEVNQYDPQYNSEIKRTMLDLMLRYEKRNRYENPQQIRI